MAFRQRRSRIQLCYPLEERRLLEAKFGWNFPKQPVIVQPKLDGERCHPIGEILPDIFLISSECNPIISVPHISQALIDQKITKEVDGELYNHQLGFSEIHSIVSRKSKETIHDDAWKMQFHIFDLADEGPQLKRIDILNNMNLAPPLFVVPSYIAHNMYEIMDFYKQFIEEGYEGIIIRHLLSKYERRRSRFILKFKPKKFDDYEIIDVIEAISKDGIPKRMVGAFLCQGADGTSFKVGAGELRHEERKAIWRSHVELDDIRGNFCKVQYQNITSKSSVPRFGLAVEVL